MVEPDSMRNLREVETIVHTGTGIAFEAKRAIEPLVIARGKCLLVPPYIW